jgi:dipeptidyl aminopeptidase/acylaminoacyl peptidase
MTMRLSRVPAAWCHGALLLFLALCAPAVARTHAVAPGEVPVLEPNEGLLLLAVDTNTRLLSADVSPQGSTVAIAKFGRAAPGYNARLFVVPAGTYYWARFNTTFNLRVTLDDDAEMRFKVEPGKVTYPGDLIYRWGAVGVYFAEIQLHNRGLHAMDWLDTNHPAIARQHAFTYSGHYPDPFPDFYRRARAASADALDSLAAVDAPPAPRALPLPPHELWRDDRISSVQLNPVGDLIAESLRLDDTHWAIDLIDLKAGESLRLVNSPAPVRSMYWSGDRTLLAGVSQTPGAEVVTVFHIQEGASGKRTFDAVLLNPLGNVVSTIVDDPDHVIYKEDRRTLIYKRDISSKTAMNGSKGAALNHNIKNDVAWWPDGRGRLRYVQAELDGGGYALWYGEGEDHYTYLMDLPENFAPQAASFDGKLLYAISDEDRAQRDLVAFDPSLKRITRTLFTRPGVDVVSALFDARQNPIGVTYFQDGRSVSEYFDARDATLTALLDRTFPGSTVSIVSRNRDSSQLVLQVESSEQAPRLYHLDVARRQASLLDSQRPWLDGKPLARSEVIKATSSDGLPIEAYLTLPAGAGRLPLVVLPHGGPIGVSDRLLFDPESQFFASLGYAVLRVNFRGSEGFGKAFREAGYNAQGTRIEDDIDAALTQALARYPLDKDRICIVGSSYGGYSALVSTMRWPHRFKCAVSVAGVSDRLLGFTATDSSQSAEGRKSLEALFGDPAKEPDAMLARSPIYHYQDLQVPLMLVHGRQDMRVDYENANRLVRMLNLAGRKPVMLTFEQGTHGWKDIDEIDKAYTAIAGFLQRYLDAGASAAAAAR